MAEVGGKSDLKNCSVVLVINASHNCNYVSLVNTHNSTGSCDYALSVQHNYVLDATPSLNPGVAPNSKFVPVLITGVVPKDTCPQSHMEWECA